MAKWRHWDCPCWLGAGCKNLFLRDGSGKRHFLVVLPAAKAACLVQLRAQIGSSRLGFASEERLQKHLGLLRGAVSPLGAINDAAHAVEILIDSSLNGNVPLELHLGVNTATIWIRFDDLLRFLHAQGSRVRMIEL